MIDVIIPVYKNLVYTKSCIESVINKENKQKINLIVINDCSPEIEITQYLTILEQEKKIILINNKKNLGFVKTVNKGMLQTKNDVILLNSDTVVTEGWIDKMYRAAYSSQKVATVTSLTNNGTISSVPLFNQDNKLPHGHTIDSFSNFVEFVSEKTYPEIPTAVGHAMFIKREIINELGLFDEITFGLGYCEENDFSMRVRKSGYKNILADDTFIYHHGSTSFGKEKEKYINENKYKLYKKHITYPFLIRRFIWSDNAVKKVCRKIQMELENER